MSCCTFKESADEPNNNANCHKHNYKVFKGLTLTLIT